MAEKFWGYMTNHESVVGNDRQDTKESKAITYEAIMKKEKIKAQKAFFKRKAQEELGIKKKTPIVSRQQIKSVLSSIGRSIQTEKAQFDVPRSRTAGTTARSIVEPPRRHLSQENFFEHKDEVEVYGDEGLTFFDSSKKGNGGRTGELFGF